MFFFPPENKQFDRTQDDTIEVFITEFIAILAASSKQEATQIGTMYLKRPIFLRTGHQQLILIMMKLIERVFLPNFSTLKFPHKYQQAYNLSHQLRTCLTLQQIKQFYLTHREQIDQYGKTYYLQYLNEYPISYGDSNAQLSEVYSTVLQFEHLNMYEEQLRHSNLIKWTEYSHYSGFKIKALIEEQEEKMMAMIDRQPFDIIDSINWLVMRKTLRGNKLVKHSLQVIRSCNLDNYSNLVAKTINIVINKINDMEWVTWKEHQQLFWFICSKYREPRKSIAKEIANAEKLSSLQLHLLGYDQVPIAIAQIYQTALQSLDQIDMRSLEVLVSIQTLLPYNYFHPQANRSILEKILERLDSRNLHIHSLPISRLPPEVVDKFIQKILSKWFSVQKTAYYINTPNIFHILNRPAFSQKLYHDFCMLKKVTMKTHSSSYFNTALYLLKYYKYDPSKITYIKKTLSQITNKYDNQIGITATIELSSFCTLFSLYELNLQNLLIEKKQRQIELEIVKLVNSFITKRKVKEWKHNTSINQIFETLHKFVDTGELKIRKLLQYSLNKDFENIEPFSYSYGANVLFSLEGSYNCYHYKSIIKELWTHFRNDFTSLADYYLMYQHKTVKLTSLIVFKLFERSNSFTAPGKILAHTDLYHLLYRKRLLEVTASYFIKNTHRLTETCLRGLSKAEIRNLLVFFRCYKKDVPKMAERFLELVVGIMDRDPDFYLTSKSPFPLEHLCLEALQLTNIVKTESEVRQKLNIFWEKCSKSSQNTLIQMHYRLCEGSASEEDKKILVDKIETKSVEGGQHEDLLRVLVFKLEGYITLSQSAETYLLAKIKQQIINYELNPLKIKEMTQGCFFSSSSIKTEESTRSLRQLLVWVVRDFRVQLGPQFYTWCIYLAHHYTHRQLIKESLQWLTIQFIDPNLANNLLYILTHYPEIVSKEFMKHLTYCVTQNLPHQCDVYKPFINFMKLYYGQIPKQYTEMVNQMQNKKAEKQSKTGLRNIFSAKSKDPNNSKDTTTSKVTTTNKDIALNKDTSSIKGTTTNKDR